MNPTDYRPSHQLLCELLRRILRNAVQADPGAAVGIGTVECQAVAALYLLLRDHPIDQRGRCRSCRHLAAVFGPRWRRCRVYAKAILCLHQLDEVLLRQLLAHESGLATAPPPAAPGRAPANDPDDTDVLPAIKPDLGLPLQTPVIPPTPTAEAGRPDRDHSGNGDDSWPRRGPSEDPPPGLGRSPQFTGGITWPS